MSSRLRMASKGSPHISVGVLTWSLPICGCPVGGGEVIRTLRGLNSKVRIIAVSGEANFYDIDLFKLAKEAGADAILRKLDPLERVVIEANTLLSRAA